MAVGGVAEIWRDDKGEGGGVWLSPENDDVIYEQPLKRRRNSPLELDVLVDEDGDAHGDQGEEDAGHEHDAQAGHPSQDGQRPGEIFLRNPYITSTPHRW